LEAVPRGLRQELRRAPIPENVPFAPTCHLTLKILRQLKAIEQTTGFLAAVSLRPEWSTELRRRTLVQEALASLQIEGNSLTIEEAFELACGAGGRFPEHRVARAPPPVDRSERPQVGQESRSESRSSRSGRSRRRWPAGWVVLTKDSRIRYRSLERDALIRAGVRAFVLTARDMTGHDDGRSVAHGDSAKWLLSSAIWQIPETPWRSPSKNPAPGRPRQDRRVLGPRAVR
jgi:hypothetical protein